MIVGGYAVAYHGYPRFTKDIASSDHGPAPYAGPKRKATFL